MSIIESKQNKYEMTIQLEEIVKKVIDKYIKNTKNKYEIAGFLLIYLEISQSIDKWYINP